MKSILELQIQIMNDKLFLRKEQFSRCKTQKEKDILLDRWVIEDSAEKISSAIRSSNRPRNIGFLGLF